MPKQQWSDKRERQYEQITGRSKMSKAELARAVGR
jgi:hypothetical protein